VKMNNK